MDCAHTLPTSPNQDREIHSRRRQTNSTNSSRLIVQGELVAQVKDCSAPHVVPFRVFLPFVLFSATAKLESLLEFVVLKKHAHVLLLKKDQANLLDLLVFTQEIEDRFGRNLSGLDLWISERARRYGWKCD